MDLYKPKDINFSFILIFRNFSPEKIKRIIESVKNNYPGRDFACILPSKLDFDPLKGCCKTYKTKTDNIISMVNLGLKNAYKEWNFIVIDRKWVPPSLNLRFSPFINNKKDILFPMNNKKAYFYDLELNFLLIHKDGCNEIGPFPELESTKMAKLHWGAEAISNGYHLKAVAGIRIE